MAGSRRTMALRRAIACTPMARVTVRMAGSPSGMAATARPTTAMKISGKGRSAKRKPKTRMKAARATMARVMVRAKRSICLRRGVVTPSTSWSMPLMRPISVVLPVATTTPSPVPAATMDPLKAMEERSPRAASSATATVVLSTATDSPVRAASWMRSPWAVVRRRSAGTLSPASRRTRSPGTSSSAGRFTRRSSRTRRARGASIPRMAERACSARPSWMKPMVALTTTTARMTTVSTQWPRRAVTAAAVRRT